MGSTSSNYSYPYQSPPVDDRVQSVLRSTPLFDGHNDLPRQLCCVTHGKIYGQPHFDFPKGFERGMTDIPRLREGAVGAQFWSICVHVFAQLKIFSTLEYSDMARDAIELLDLATRLIELYPHILELVRQPEDVKRVYDEGEIACSMGGERLHMTDNSIDIIRAFYKLGACGPIHSGLSSLGCSCVKEINRLGMIVDVSQVTMKCAEQVLNSTRVPVMFLHSNAVSD
ncbi:uncharacterized protein Z518_01047 [Rhinocladiella mackenziei CBS 650.93]|uniref:Dipeptidase n=1 Tax=Rhinocladiella mackenziei CBS 650.93 TaxID=1442369 RepID=A0A0D2J2U3_9EURO|nr:uncharacterized protein Z518_01047 [Rhinocladiella mackenziei CBS 650.93]KIX09966.1 hypothetical protein Z518_01047 [Rhinocladiella mackenziei CBS 650.93]